MCYTTFLIDLDETLYPSETQVWPEIAARMDRFMHERLHIPWETIPTMRDALYLQYGTTLRGLVNLYQVDEQEFVNFVHDVPVDVLLQPDPELREVLLRYPQRKLIFTNGDRAHATRVLQRLGLENCFDGIVDVLHISPYCKPMPEAFAAALRYAGDPNPRHCVFMDDSPRNLGPARELGIYTIQIGGVDQGVAHAWLPRPHDLPLILPPEQYHG